MHYTDEVNSSNQRHIKLLSCVRAINTKACCVSVLLILRLLPGLWEEFSLLDTHRGWFIDHVPGWAFSTSQEIGWEEDLWNDLFSVEWDVRPHLVNSRWARVGQFSRDLMTVMLLPQHNQHFYLLMFRSLSETFIRRSLFISSSGSCHNRDRNVKR